MSFKPPIASKKQLEGVPFDQAVDTLPEARQRFADFDATPAGKSDPNLCKALLKFPDGTIFWSSKMAVDADGVASAPGRPKGKELDPGSGTNQTSFRFSSGKSLSAEAHHYVVIPLKPGSDTESFHPDIGTGDVAVVIYKDKITAAICGDMGPSKRIGEGSIRVHEDFHPPGPDPCKKRDQDGGFCLRILNASIEEDVLFFIFPNSDFGDELTPAEIETKVKERAFTRYNELRGIS